MHGSALQDQAEAVGRLVAVATRLLLSSGGEGEGEGGAETLRMRLSLCRGLSEAWALQSGRLHSQSDASPLDAGLWIQEQVMLACLLDSHLLEGSRA